MKKEYEEWIKKHVPTPEVAYGKCAYFAKLMVKDFPELTIAKGFIHVLGTDLKNREHWWLKDPLGLVVDPTSKQFPHEFVHEHEELAADHPAMIHQRQRCMNCGTVFYDTRPTFCTDKCFEEFKEWQG